MRNIIKHRKLKGIVVLFTGLAAAFLLSDSVYADNIVTAGTTVRVTAGTTLVSQSALTIRNGGTLTNLGTVILRGNLVNENVSPSLLGAGTIVMGGTALQTMSGQNSMGNLTINNAAGVSIGGNTTVTGVLTLTSGRVNLGANNLLLETAASVAGAPSATSMVVATGTGELRKSFSGIGSFTFPVGDNSGTAEYTPVTLNFTGGTFGAGNYAGVNVTNSPYPGASGSYLNRFWGVTQSGISSFNCNATFKYMPADVIGTENQIYCLRITPTSVVYFSVANVASDLLTANGLSQFGTFTGVQILADKTLNLTALIEGLYTGSGTMRKAQNSTGDQFTGLTADQVFIELHSSASYLNKMYTSGYMNLSTTGNSAISIPGIFNGSYYVTLRHRNSVETTSAAPVSFAGNPVNYNFNGTAQAYGGNLLQMYDGWYVIYGGDVNQNGTVDTGDMTPVDNDASAFVTGYLPTDINGDGTVDTGDMTIIDNNSSAFISAETP